MASMVIVGTGYSGVFVRAFTFQTDHKILCNVANFTTSAVTVIVSVAVFFVRLVKS